MPEPRTITPEKPQFSASCWLTTPMLTLRCLKMRLSVSRPSMSWDLRRELFAPGFDVVDQLRRQILVHAARAHIIGVHARARSALVEHHQLFALFKAPERRRQRADVHGLRGDVQQMVQNAPDFGIKHADDRGAPRHVDAGELFDRQAERVSWFIGAT